MYYLLINLLFVINAFASSKVEVDRQFIEACSYNDSSKIRQIIEKNKTLNLNVQFNDSDFDQPGELHKFTPLHFAVYSKNLEMVQWLIKNGADVNRYSFYGFTPLDLAIKFGFIEAFDLLTLNYGKVSGKLGSNCILHCAILCEKLYLVKHLVNFHDLNQVDKNLYTPLLYAISKNNPEIVKILLDNGATLKKVDYSRHSPIVYSIIMVSFDCFKTIVDFNREIIKDDGSNLLKFASKFKCPKIISFLLCSNAISSDSLKEINLNIKNLNIEDKLCLTPLMWAVITNDVTSASKLLNSRFLPSNKKSFLNKFGNLFAKKQIVNSSDNIYAIGLINPNTRNFQGETAYQLSLKFNNDAISNMINNYLKMPRERIAKLLSQKVSVYIGRYIAQFLY